MLSEFSVWLWVNISGSEVATRPELLSVCSQRCKTHLPRSSELRVRVDVTCVGDKTGRQACLQTVK